MAARRFTLRSPHSPDVCVDRLHDAMGHHTLPGQRKVIGKVTEAQLTLACQIGSKPRGFNPVMRARLFADRDGTQISGRIGISGFAMIFMAAWFGFLSIIIVAGFFNLENTNRMFWGLPFFLMPILMIMVAVTKISGRRKASQGDREILLDFLKDTVEAHDDGTDYRSH